MTYLALALLVAGFLLMLFAVIDDLTAPLGMMGRNGYRIWRLALGCDIVGGFVLVLTLYSKA